MTTTNRLFYTVSKRYIQAGTTFKIDVKILLADDCKNNICDWSITADIYEQRKNGRFVWCAGGCCHEEILKRFPQFKMFVDLHLSTRFPNFHKSGSIRGMKKQYYGVAALLVRCGSYIYNVTSEPNIYYNAK